MQRRAWRSLKWASLIISLGSIALALWLMQSGGPQQAVQREQPTADDPKTEVESPVIVERKDGRISWQLRAAEASQQLDGKMRLNLPVLTLYNDNGEQIIINSRQAWFEPVRRDVRFEDHVIVRFNDWRLQSELLIYVSGADEIRIPGAFTLRGRSISARGSNMRLRRESEEIDVEGGIWIQDSNAHWQGAGQ